MKTTPRSNARSARPKKSLNPFLAVCMMSIIEGAPAQSRIPLADIILTDTLSYASFAVEEVFNAQYPPSCLFDGDLKTCWVAGSVQSKENPVIFIRLPDRPDIRIHLFSGYGKSPALYEANARPSRIRLSVLAGINPDGFVTECAIQFKAVKFPGDKTVEIPEGFDWVSIPLDITAEDLASFRRTVRASYDSDIGIPAADSALILKLEVLESRPGTRYDDICISEIFFNDRLVSPQPLSIPSIERVYTSDNEHALVMDTAEKAGIEVYRDPASVLQLMETSEDGQWAILIAMPARIEGRAETTYLLVNLFSRELFNARLEAVTGDYLPGNEMFFETGEDGTVRLLYVNRDGEYGTVELR